MGYASIVTLDDLSSSDVSDAAVGSDLKTLIERVKRQGAAGIGSSFGPWNLCDVVHSTEEHSYEFDGARLTSLSRPGLAQPEPSGTAATVWWVYDDAADLLSPFDPAEVGKQVRSAAANSSRTSIPLGGHSNALNFAGDIEAGAAIRWVRNGLTTG